MCGFFMRWKKARRGARTFTAEQPTPPLLVAPQRSWQWQAQKTVPLPATGTAGASPLISQWSLLCAILPMKAHSGAL